MGNALASRTTATATASEPAERDFTRLDVAHLLRRAGFASTPAEVDDLLAEADWAAVVDRVLDTSGNPPDTTPAAVDSRTKEFGKAWVAAVHSWMDRMVTTPTPIVEKVTFFWHGVLTSAVYNPKPRLVFKQIQTWRRLGLGDVHALLQAMAKDPAMLLYLDNATNRAAQPNENFARELMELFTMGNGTFTEDDVIAMARAWTGHNYDRATETYLYRPTKHDGGQKTLFGITKAWDGPAALTEIVRGSKQDVCARYLAGRLWSFFAAPNPPPALLDELAQAFVDGDMDVEAFLRTIFLRPEFRAVSTRAALVRSPIEWQVAAMRAADLTAVEVRPERHMPQLGQVLLQPPNVSGWRQNRAWISSSAQWGKAAFATKVAQKAKAAGTFDHLVGSSPDAAVADLLDRFGVDDPSSATRADLERYLTAERAAGRGAMAASSLVGLVLLTPDFQLA